MNGMNEMNDMKDMKGMKGIIYFLTISRKRTTSNKYNT